MSAWLWERIKGFAKLALGWLLIGVIWGLLVEGVCSWRAGHWLDADEWIAAEDGAVLGFASGLCRVVLLPVGGTAADCEVRP